VQAMRLLVAALEKKKFAVTDRPRKRMQAGAKAFLEMLAEHPNESQTLLVEIIGVGDRDTAFPTGRNFGFHEIEGIDHQAGLVDL